MRTTLFAGCLLGGLALTGVARAQGTPVAMTPDTSAYAGKEAGGIMVRLRAIGVIPLDSGSSVSGIGGSVHASASAAPELDVSYFFTDNIAAELIAASTQHNVWVSGSALGHVNVGNVWVLPPTVTLQYHFMPHERFSPYVGAGLNLTFFYATQGSYPVSKFNLGTNVGAALQAGFDYNVTGRWFLNFDVKQIFLSTSGDVHVPPLHATLHAKTDLNPLVIGAGIGYRF